MEVAEIRKHLRKIRKNIGKSCKKAGRDPDEVRVIVVTRNRRVPEIRDVIDAGCRVFGENRVQEAIQKISFFEPEIEWHLIGHLQSVKAKASIKSFKLIHTVDSLRIGYDLQSACEKLDREANILIQVNTMDVEAQFGVIPSEAITLIRELVKFSKVHIRGLMTEIPPFEDPEESRVYYRRLRDLRETVKEASIEGVEMKWLSMGNSFDYKVAVEEGSNLVRITEPIFSEE